jgi:hypothetical protein
MDKLITSKVNRTYAFRGTQLPDSTAAISGPSSSSTQLDVPSISSTLSKRKLSSFDPSISTQSSASSKRKRMPSSVDIRRSKLDDKIEDTIGEIKSSLRDLKAPPPAPPPPPPPPGSETGVAATNKLLDTVELIAQRGDQWILDSDVMRIVNIFRRDELAVKYFLTVAARHKESLIHVWVDNQLQMENAADFSFANLNLFTNPEV